MTLTRYWKSRGISYGPVTGQLFSHSALCRVVVSKVFARLVHGKKEEEVICNVDCIDVGTCRQFVEMC